MQKEIKGSIDYTVIILENGEWEIEYERSIENEIVALSISQHVMEHSIAAANVAKKESTGKVLKSIKEQVDKFIQARMGIKMLCDNLCSVYESYMEDKKKHDEEMLTAEVTEKDKEVLKKMMNEKNQRG